jgi:UDP-glucuronate 4-epimerase
MRTILLTGAAGFIGSHAAETLVKHGYRVVGVDNLDLYYSTARKQENLRELRAALGHHAPFELVLGDLRDEALLDRVFAARPYHAIVHLGALPGVRASLDDPQRYVDVNLNGTLGLLTRAVRHSVPQFVFASTSSVYGACGDGLLSESASCDRPLAPYPATKRAAEMMAYAYHQLHGLAVTCLRFFTVYGPRARPDMMTYRLVDAMFTGQPVPLYAGGRMLRDWTYVSDIVSGIEAAVARPLGFEIVNLGRGEPMLLSDYVRELERCTGLRAPVRGCCLAMTPSCLCAKAWRHSGSGIVRPYCERPSRREQPHDPGRRSQTPRTQHSDGVARRTRHTCEALLSPRVCNFTCAFQPGDAGLVSSRIARAPGRLPCS